jgi:hypothetical protein
MIENKRTQKHARCPATELAVDVCWYPWSLDRLDTQHISYVICAILIPILHLETSSSILSSVIQRQHRTEYSARKYRVRRHRWTRNGACKSQQPGTLVPTQFSSSSKLRLQTRENKLNPKATRSM